MPNTAFVGQMLIPDPTASSEPDLLGPVRSLVPFTLAAVTSHVTDKPGRLW